jgi:hypothetical protein
MRLRSLLLNVKWISKLMLTRKSNENINNTRRESKASQNTQQNAFLEHGRKHY